MVTRDPFVLRTYGNQARSKKYVTQSWNSFINFEDPFDKLLQKSSPSPKNICSLDEEIDDAHEKCFAGLDGSDSSNDKESCSRNQPCIKKGKQIKANRTDKENLKDIHNPKKLTITDNNSKYDQQVSIKSRNITGDKSIQRPEKLKPSHITENVINNALFSANNANRKEMSSIEFEEILCSTRSKRVRCGEKKSVGKNKITEESSMCDDDGDIFSIPVSKKCCSTSHDLTSNSNHRRLKEQENIKSSSIDRKFVKTSENSEDEQEINKAAIETSKQRLKRTKAAKTTATTTNQKEKSRSDDYQESSSIEFQEILNLTSKKICENQKKKKKSVKDALRKFSENDFAPNLIIKKVNINQISDHKSVRDTHIPVSSTPINGHISSFKMSWEVPISQVVFQNSPILEKSVSNYSFITNDCSSSIKPNRTNKMNAVGGESNRTNHRSALDEETRKVENRNITNKSLRDFERCIPRVSIVNGEILDQSEEGSISLLFFDLPKKITTRSKHLNNENAILRLCGQSKILSFDDVFTKRLSSITTNKIGEGSFSEVFKIFINGQHRVIKIIPIAGIYPGSSEENMSLTDVLSEIVITRIMSELRTSPHNACSSFIHLLHSNFVKGKYPESLVKAWDRFANDKQSENCHPESFPDDQKYLILQFEVGGNEFEHFNFSSSKEIISAFYQTACALAVAEKALNFEHRDLHCSNILISKTKCKSVTYLIDDRTIEVPTTGIVIKIIDFTLSRLEKNTVKKFSDLSNCQYLFTGQGDSQYDVYREMKKITNDNWKNYHPKTNVLWLTHILEKLADRLASLKLKCKPTLKMELSTIKNILEDCTSSCDFVNKYEIS